MEATAARWPWWYGLVAVALVTGVGIGVFEVVEALGADTLSFDLIFTELCIVAVVVVMARRHGPVNPRTFGLRRMSITPGRAAWWIFLGLIAVGVANRIYIEAVGDIWGDTDFGYFPGQTEAIVLAFAAVVAAPIAEELLFRGFLYRGLRNSMRVLPAVAISSVLFGLIHWWFGDPFLSVFPRVTIGVFLALLYERTGSLYPCIVAHAWINVTIASVFVPEAATGMRLAGLIVLLVAVGMSVRDPRRKKLARKTREEAAKAPRFVRTGDLTAPESMRTAGIGV